jgi:MFS family permease
MARTPDRARGRVSATANAIFGGAQGASLLLGGAVAVALSPRVIYAVAGLLGLATAGILAVTYTSPDSALAAPTEAAAPRQVESRWSSESRRAAG